MVENMYSQFDDEITVCQSSIHEIEDTKKQIQADISDLQDRKAGLYKKAQLNQSRAKTLEAESRRYVKRWESLNTLLSGIPLVILVYGVYSFLSMDTDALQGYFEAVKAAQPDFYERCMNGLLLSSLEIFVAAVISSLAVLLSCKSKNAKTIRIAPIVVVVCGAIVGAVGVMSFVESELLAQADASAMSSLRLTLLFRVYLPIVLAPVAYEVTHGVLIAKATTKKKEGAELLAQAISIQDNDISGIDMAIAERRAKCEVYDSQIKQFDQLKGAERELHDLIGLESVKAAVVRWKNRIEFERAMGEDSKPSLNCLFLGSPGTGKTEVARIMGKLMYGIGLIPRADVIEVSRPDLVGQYIGETAIKTKEIIESAEGAVLFIDEAYQLAPEGGSGGDFGREALETIMKAMEDRRGKMAFIFAGYSNEMQGMLDANPGIRSRIPETNRFSFEDYSVDELLKIAKLMLEARQLKFDDEAPAAFKRIIETRVGSYDFGNARGVRNLVDELYDAQSAAWIKDKTIDMHLISAETVKAIA
jgi:stage V sporulation protein K